jgi:hypothetical protein
MSVGLYTIEVPALHKGDQTVSNKYDWWFYAEDGYTGYLSVESRLQPGTHGTPAHDRLLPSMYLTTAIVLQGRPDWARALHSYVAMHEWKIIVPGYEPDWRPISPAVHRPLHELVHRVDNGESGISDDYLLKLVIAEEREIVGYTRDNPFRKEHNAPPR